MNTTVERLIEIEQERDQTQRDPKFQEWMKKLNVSRMHVDRKGLIQAKDIMNQYDYSKHTYRINIS
jgi:uncharacterized protein with PIN domain